MRIRYGVCLLLPIALLFINRNLSAQNLAGWTLTFDDEFNGTTLDTTKWNTCFQNQGVGTGTPCTLAGNSEMELYQPSSQFTEANGVLTIRGDKKDTVDPVSGATYHYASGVISSHGKFNQVHGYFEMRAKLPSGTGYWPAFWMENDNNGWPPEIDTLEMIGNMPDAPHVAAIQSQTGAYLAKYVYTFDTSTAYHSYAVEWDATNLTYYYDGQIVSQTTTAANMTSPMQLIANLAIGGTWPGAPTAATIFPGFMNIDYIRAWTRNDVTAPIPFAVGYDVGSTGLPGSTSISANGAATIQGAGSGYFAYASDSFQYAAQPLPGDGDFTMKVSSVPPSNNSFTPQTGIMVRDGLASDARYTAIFLANGKCILQSRTTTGGVSARVATLSGISYPSWLRLIRRGDTFSAYISSDGVSWNLVGTTKNDISSSTMASSALIGAAISSGDPTTYNTAGISNFNLPSVQITQDNADLSGVSVAGTWTASTNNGGYYGANYITDGNANKGSDSVVFTPTLPSAASYDVYFRWVGNETARETNVPIAIAASDGVHHVTVNEQHRGSEWILLGTYPLSTGTSGSVTISNGGTTNTVSVDAVRFVPGISPAPLGPTLPSVPTGVSSIETPDTNQVTLSWSPASLATSYNVMRASGSGSFTTIATLVSTSLNRYTDTTVMPGTVYSYQIAGVNESGQGESSTAVTAMPSYIADDAGADVTKVGAWTSSTSAPTLYYGNDYLQDGDTGATGGKSVSFAPGLPVAGNYYVFLRWPSGGNRAANVPVDINADGSTTHLTVDETASGEWWSCLGSFGFATGSTDNVTIRNDNANGYVIADAVEFVRNFGGSTACPTQTAQSLPTPERAHRSNAEHNEKRILQLIKRHFHKFLYSAN
jgi:beta-glucanase (GH16 family)